MSLAGQTGATVKTNRHLWPLVPLKSPFPLLILQIPLTLRVSVTILFQIKASEESLLARPVCVCENSPCREGHSIIKVISLCAAITSGLSQSVQRGRWRVNWMNAGTQLWRMKEAAGKQHIQLNNTYDVFYLVSLKIIISKTVVVYFEYVRVSIQVVTLHFDSHRNAEMTMKHHNYSK